MEKHGKQHFLVVTYPAQGHINPAHHLARRLATTTGAAVTFTTAVSAHRRMFTLSAPDQEVGDGVLTYIPYSDGYDSGYKSENVDATVLLKSFRRNGYNNVSAIVRNLAARGCPVTCIIYTILLPWVADVARDQGIPSVLYWIQPATVFSIYFRVLHGLQSYITAHGDEPSFPVNLPGLPPLQIQDLPSFLTVTNTKDPYYPISSAFREMFDVLDREADLARPRVLFNTYDALETDAMASLDKIDTIPIGPLLPCLFTDTKGSNEKSSDADLFKVDGNRYMEWLDGKPEGSVVYVSFGSMSMMSKKQMDEILKGLKQSKRPYLWVVRKDNRGEGIELEEERKEGMVVEWCSQVKVLQHPAVGCFITHCGWNSTLESLVCGVPVVGAPQWTDQGTNAKLVEAVWGNGVRSKVNEEGILEAEELGRCLEIVMGKEQRGVEIRSRAKMWRDKAVAAVMEGGPSDRNLKYFVEQISRQ